MSLGNIFVHIIPLVSLECILLFATGLGPGGIMADELEKDGMEILKARMREMALSTSPSASAIQEVLKGLQEDGTWSSINYAGKERTGWSPFQHVSKLHLLSRGLRHPESSMVGDPELKEKFLLAYDAWTERDLRCPNWWWNEIGVPRTLYRVLLVSEADFSEERLDSGLRILSRAELGMTGQNLVWVAEVTMARGCLSGDADLVRAAFQRIEREIRLSEGEGIQHDYSFHQHGDQLYSGGYGRGFSTDCPRIAYWARGTCFQMKQETLNLLVGYLLEGQQWMTRGKRFDYSACGREIVRSRAGGIGGLAGACSQMAELHPDRREQLQEMSSRLQGGGSPLTGNKHFFRSDYMVHHRQDFFVSVRMTSPRVLQSETCNGENRHGLFLSDGANYLYTTGDEYMDVFSVWDWRRIPGITAEWEEAPPVIQGKRRGQRSFVGGVSDGQFGLAAMDFVREGLQLKKTWAFFDEGWISAGTGLSCDSDRPVMTTVNQCLLKGEVFTSASREPFSGNELVLEGPSWVKHDQVLYLFPEGAHLRLREVEGRRLFQLWIDHGVRPNQRTYEYAVLPDVHEKDEVGKHFPVLLENKARLQSFWCEGEGRLSLVFWEAGKTSFPGGERLEVDRPCLLLLERSDDGWRGSLSDPSQKEDVVGVRFDAGTLEVHQVELPKGPYAGQSVSFYVRDELSCYAVEGSNAE